MLRVVETELCPQDYGLTEPEDCRFARAFQSAGIADFRCAYLLVYREESRVSVVPYFTTDYRLNTLVTNPFLKWLLAPLGFKVACVGHPSTDVGHIEGEISAEILQAVNGVLRSKAAAIAYKWFTQALPLETFVEARGLPVNVLKAAVDYPASLARKRRRNVRNKIKKSAMLVFNEYTPEKPLPAALTGEIYRLYAETVDHADLHFEHLNADYFRLTAAISTYMLAYEGERLIGFVQWIRKGNRMSGKYAGMDYTRNRRYDLYFGIVLQSVLHGIRNGVTEFDLGIGNYYSKRLIGAVLLPTRLYFRHHNFLVQWFLARCKFLLEPSVEELV